MSAASSTAAVPRDESSTTASPATRGGSGDRPFSRPGPDYADMMSRYLGPQIMAAMEDDDVTEICVNPQDGRVRLDRRSRGRMDAGCVIGAERLEMFLNSVADTQATLLTPSSPTLQAELLTETFRGAHLQGFVPSVTSAAALVIRKRSDATFPLQECVRPWDDGLEASDASIEALAGRRGGSYDNALADSVIGLSKTEVVRQQGPWRGLEHVEYATLDWVPGFNTQRLLAPLGYLPPGRIRGAVSRLPQTPGHATRGPRIQRTESPAIPGRFTFGFRRDG